MGGCASEGIEEAPMSMRDYYRTKAAEFYARAQNDSHVFNSASIRKHGDIQTKKQLLKY
jgi:hypothetical protein